MNEALLIHPTIPIAILVLVVVLIVVILVIVSPKVLHRKIILTRGTFDKFDAVFADPRKVCIFVLERSSFGEECSPDRGGGGDFSVDG